jgi:molecular chaperone DnaK (HSP70)
MANDRVVGIDLGTTNSLVAYMEGEQPTVIPGEDGSNLVPSLVALDSDL